MCLHRKEIPATTAIGKEVRRCIREHLKGAAKERLVKVRQKAGKSRVLNDGKK